MAEVQAAPATKSLPMHSAIALPDDWLRTVSVQPAQAADQLVPADTAGVDGSGAEAGHKRGSERRRRHPGTPPLPLGRERGAGDLGAAPRQALLRQAFPGVLHRRSLPLQGKQGTPRSTLPVSKAGEDARDVSRVQSPSLSFSLASKCASVCSLRSPALRREKETRERGEREGQEREER